MKTHQKFDLALGEILVTRDNLMDRFDEMTELVEDAQSIFFNFTFFIFCKTMIRNRKI